MGQEYLNKVIGKLGPDWFRCLTCRECGFVELYCPDAIGND